MLHAGQKASVTVISAWQGGQTLAGLLVRRSELLNWHFGQVVRTASISVTHFGQGCIIASRSNGAPR
jgi:hypothetical protein